MNNLLIICGSFPPQADVGGLRPAMFAKCLPEFGWEPYVLTQEWPIGDPYRKHTQDIAGIPDSSRIHRVVYGAKDAERAAAERNMVGKTRSFFKPETAHPCGAMDRMFAEAQSLWPGTTFKAMLATVPDLYPLGVARALHQSRGIPWVADLRDIAEQEDGMAGSLRWHFLRLRKKLRRNRLLKSAALVTVVSQTHARIMSRQFRGPVEVVYNGYDTPLCEVEESLNSRRRFRVVYAGRILNTFYQNPIVLFEGLDLLLTSGRLRKDELMVEFFGTDKSIVESLVAAFRCKPMVQVMESVPHAGVASLLKSASALLLLTNRERKGVLTTKLFEYLPVNRPILCVPGDGGELDAILRETGVGRSCENAQAVAGLLSSWLSEWKAQGFVSVRSNLNAISRFSRRRQTQVLASLLDERVVIHRGVRV